MKAPAASIPPPSRDALEPGQLDFFSADVYCPSCGNEHVKLLEPTQVYEGTRLFLLGRCADCGAVQKSEMHTLKVPSPPKTGPGGGR